MLRQFSSESKMATRIKSIKCPQCGSTRVEELANGRFRCRSCSTTFFLDSDDITIHHQYDAPQLRKYLTRKNLVVVLISVVGMVVLYALSSILSPRSSSTQSLLSSGRGDIENVKEEEPEPEFEAEYAVPFANKDGMPMIALFGVQRTGQYPKVKEDFLLKIYDVTAEEMVSASLLPIDRLGRLEYRLFANGKLNIIINERRWFVLDRQLYSLEEQNSYREIEQLSSGFASVKFDYIGRGDGMELMTNLGKAYYYYPSIGKVYTKDQYFDALNSRPPHAVVRTAFAFSSVTDDYPEQDIQLLKVKQYWKDGYPHDFVDGFGWYKDFGGKFIVYTDRDPYTKAFISKYNANRVRLISYKDFTPGSIYFNPDVFYFNDSILLIGYKPTAAPDAVYQFQLLDANTAERKWTTQKPAELSGSVANDEAVLTSKGFLLAYGRKVWLLGLDGRNRSISSFY